jgi:hypothetical protein
VLNTRYVVDSTGLREFNVLSVFDTLIDLGVLTDRPDRVLGRRMTRPVSSSRMIRPILPEDSRLAAFP